jgi:hypothetical protein
MNKKIVFLFIAGIFVIILLVSLVNAAKRRQATEPNFLRPPAKLGQGSSENTPIEKGNTGGSQEEPETEPPIKAGEQLLN